MIFVPLDDGDSPVEGLDEGTLAIHTNVRPNFDIWKRPQPRFRPKPSSTTAFHSPDSAWLTFEIPFARIMSGTDSDPRYPLTIEDNNRNGGGSGSAHRYVVYDVHLRQDTGTPDQLDTDPARIERRYTHFLHLYNALRRAHPTRMQSFANFPKKTLLGNFGAALLAERSASFERFLDHVMADEELRESDAFAHFLYDIEVQRAGRLLDERRNELAVPILANAFRLLNRVYTDKKPCVLLLLCRLCAACTTSPVPHADAERWCELALRRYETVSDADLLVLYVPLLQTCLHLWWQRGRDNAPLAERLQQMVVHGVNTKATVTLTQAIHAMDPRTETM